MNDKISLIATAAFGVEAIVVSELNKLGFGELTVENGRISFDAGIKDICRTNLWLRCADRVLLKMGQFKATSFEELFEGTKSLPWEEWIPADAEFPVSGKSLDSKLFSVPDCQAIVKKAIVEKLKQKYHKEWFPETGPKYAIEVALLKDTATLTIDTSGAGLHKRGYRKLTGAAPLKETLASAMIYISRWNKDKPLIDPFCGSGTIPVEAAMIGSNIAPGLKREFAAEKWHVIPDILWSSTRNEAEAAIQNENELKISGYDIDDNAISLARFHAKQAGVESRMHLQRLPLSELRSKAKNGCIICNPPFGERSGDIASAEKIYAEMGNVFRQLDSWSFYILSPHLSFEKLFGRRADKKRKLFNGGIQCNYYQYFGPSAKKIGRRSNSRQID